MTAAGFLVFLILLLILVLLLNGQKEKKEKAAGEQQFTSSLIFSEAPESIREISFETEEGTLTFEKKEDQWFVPGDDNLEVDSGKMSTLTGDLAALSAVRNLGVSQDPEQYGLGEKAREVRITTDEGTKLLLIGERNASTGEVYVQTDPQGEVYVVSRALDEHFNGRLADFAVYERFPSIEPSSMRIFDVRKAEGSYVLTMPGDDKCTVTDEKGNVQGASLGVVGSIQETLAGISWLTNEEYHCTDPEKYGLDLPRATIDIIYEDSGSEQTVKLKIGTEDPEGNYYTEMNENGQVHTVRREYLSGLVESSPEDFWSMTYSFVSIGDMDSLTVSDGKETHTLTRHAENEGHADEKIEYYFDGSEVEKELFTDFYYACVSVTAQERLQEVPEYAEGEEALKLIYSLKDGGEKTICYYPYDQNFYTVIYENGQKAGQTNKLYVNTMLEALERLTEAVQ